MKMRITGPRRTAGQEAEEFPTPLLSPLSPLSSPPLMHSGMVVLGSGHLDNPSRSGDMKE